MKRIGLPKVSRNEPRRPSWTQSGSWAWFDQLFMELPKFWDTSTVERAGFISAIEAGKFEEFVSARRPADKLFHLAKVLRKHVAVAWKVFALLDGVDSKLSRRFADLFLRYLALQYDTRGSLNDEDDHRNEIVLRLQIRVTRFLICHYFRSPFLPRLNGQELKYFVGHLAELLERCDDDEPLRLLGVELVFEITSCLEACARALYEDTVRKSGLSESEWAVFNSVFSGLIEEGAAEFLTNGPIDKLGRTMHYLWATPFTFQGSQGHQNDSKSVSELAVQAGFLVVVRESLQGYRKAIKVVAFPGKFGDKEACLFR